MLEDSAKLVYFFLRDLTGGISIRSERKTRNETVDLFHGLSSAVFKDLHCKFKASDIYGSKSVYHNTLRKVYQ